MLEYFLFNQYNASVSSLIVIIMKSESKGGI